MALFLIRRLITLLVTLAGASVMVFLVLEVLPGNAAQVLMGPDASPEALAALTTQLGLDQPALARYGQWIAGLLTGDLGLSSTYSTPVSELVIERLALTVPLAAMAMALTVAIARPDPAAKRRFDPWHVRFSAVANPAPFRARKPRASIIRMSVCFRVISLNVARSSRRVSLPFRPKSSVS